MAGFMLRCEICRSMLDEEDLFCSNCGTESPHRQGMDAVADQVASLHSFRCDSCGASMSYDASAQSLRCPFCGGQALTAQRDARTLKPDRVIAFAFPFEKAQQILQGFLTSGFWRPGDAWQRSTLGEVTQVFVPFWVYAATTSTYWAGDTSAVPAGARGNWFPMSGEHSGSYEGLLVVASSTLTPAEVQQISPFALDRGQPPSEVDLENVIVEEFRLPRKYARPLAVAQIERLESEQCRRYLPGSARNIRVNTQVSGMQSEPMLLPIWIMVYRYRDRPYRVLINGQTGTIAGAAPFSYGKLSLILILLALIVLGIVAGVLLFSRS